MKKPLSLSYRDVGYVHHKKNLPYYILLFSMLYAITYIIGYSRFLSPSKSPIFSCMSKYQIIVDPNCCVGRKVTVVEKLKSSEAEIVLKSSVTVFMYFLPFFYSETQNVILFNSKLFLDLPGHSFSLQGIS